MSTKDMRIFFLYTVLFSLSFILSLLFRFYIQSAFLTTLIIRLAIVIEFASLALFYYYNIIFAKKKAVLIFSTSLFIVYSVYDFCKSKNDEFNYIPLVIESLFFLVIITYFFYEQMQHNIEKPIYQSPAFWISVAFIVYFAGNFFQFLFSSNVNDPQFFAVANTVYDSTTIIKNILLCTGIVVNNTFDNKPTKINYPINIDLDSFYPPKTNTSR